MPRRRFARWQFETLFARHCRQAGKRVSRRRLESCWISYRGVLRASCRAQGGCFRTTNGQRATQMDADGRTRSVRTVQRLHRELEAMGVVTVRHVRRSGAARRPGELDCLAISLKNPSFVMPRFAEPQQGEKPPSGVSPLLAEAAPTTSTTGLAPPSAADAEPPDEPGERPLNLEDQIAAQLRFQQHKLDIGFGDPIVIQAKMGELRRQLRELSGQERERTCSRNSRGFR